MSSKLSVTEILASLEAKMALHREREAFHGEQEASHREQRAAHAAELESVARHYEAFKAAAGSAAEIAARPGSPAPQEALPAGKPVVRSKLVARVVAELPAGETFTPSRIAGEVNRRFGKALKKPADSRLASAALLRMLADGRVRLVEKGTSHRESVYTRG